jgi:hypothetical protein
MSVCTLKRMFLLTPSFTTCEAMRAPVGRPSRPVTPLMNAFLPPISSELWVGGGRGVCVFYVESERMDEWMDGWIDERQGIGRVLASNTAQGHRALLSIAKKPHL